MSRTLDELRARPPAARDERALTVCLKPDLAAEVMMLTNELEALPGPNEERQGPPLRMGEKSRANEIRESLAGLLSEIAEHEGEIRVRANLDDGQWRQWVDAHPARDEGQDGSKRDERWAFGLCDIDALVDELDKFVQSWNCEPLREGDWDAIFAPTINLPDKCQMAQAVVGMYEMVSDFPRWRRSLSASLSKSSDSVLRGPSNSQTDASTDGSPAPTSEASTETATA